MFSSTPTQKQVSLPKVQSGETKNPFRLAKNCSKKAGQLGLYLYFEKADFFPPCKFIARDVNATKKRAQFLALMKMIQGNCIELVADLRVFLSHYFDLDEKDLKNISEIIKHEHPFIDSLPLIKKFYTDSVKNFLTMLNYQSYELVVDWDDIPEIEPLLKEIVIDLASMGVFVEKNQDYFPLSGFNLSHIQLPEGSNLSYRICRHANFTGAVLTGANFQEAKAQYATFTDADLSGADFTSAKLLGAHFEYANLQGAKFSSAKMNDIHLEEADLQGANLQGADLTGANLTGTKLAGANLAGADLTGANLTGTKLAGANLAGAVLKGTRLYIADLVGWNFQNALIAGALFEPNLPTVCNTEHVTTYLSHNAPNLLHALDSLPWSYASTKIQLMENLITRLDSSAGWARDCMLTYKTSLNTVLFSHPAYIESNVIATFVQDILLKTPPLLKQMNTQVHYFTELELIQLFTDFIEPYIFTEYLPRFITQFSSVINQIMFACRGKSTDLQIQGRKLAQLYHQSLPKWIKDLCARDGLDLTIDFSNQNNDYMMIFLPPSQNQLQNVNEAAIFSSHYYETHGLDRDKGASWTGFQIITHNSTNESSYNPNNHVNALFNIVPLFKEPFRIKNGAGLMGLFLRELNISEQAQQLFMAAFQHSSFNPEQQDRLYFQGLEGEPRAQAIVESWLNRPPPDQAQEGVRVSSIFLKTMDRVFPYAGDQETQKVILVLISSVFARLSSQVFYGTESNGVFFFRFLALACMNTAKAIPNPLPGTWDLTHWQSLLQNKDSCSESLSAGIISVGRRSAPQTASFVIPTIW